MASTTLVIWMNGLRVGTWDKTRGIDVLQYDPQWVQSPAGRALSLSLPFTPGNIPHRGEVVANYFDNLLPDSDAIRSRIRSKFGTSSTNAFDLLTAIGRDCVGAVQLLPENEEPTGFDRIEAEPLTDEDIEQSIAASLSGTRVLGQDQMPDFRISIAGAQEKTAFLLSKGRWCRPLGATPTTHIFKLPLGLIGHLQIDMQDSVENEWLCSRVVHHFGLPVAACMIQNFGSRKVLVIERFDRKHEPTGWIARLPQEDFCQALGLPTTKKYESEGGPGITEIIRVLDASYQAVQDKKAFVKTQVIFWMLAATDGHAKNFSLFHERDGKYRLTPLYDVLSAWPVIGPGPNRLDWRKARLAMAVRSKNAHWKLSEIRPHHWDSVTTAAGLGDASELIEEIVTETPRVIEIVKTEIPPEFPPIAKDKILEGLQWSANVLAGTATGKPPFA
jgi:serine/threonine-protein kinase HipA